MDAMRPVLPLIGGCSCEGVRYEILSFPLLLYTCSCTDCQTTTGSAFALNMPVATKSFRLIKGEPKGWHRTSTSGADSTSWFCGTCSARIFGSRKSRPDSVNVRAGTLDQTRWLIPIAHMFRSSSQGWIDPAAGVNPTLGVECHDAHIDDFRGLALKWRRLWPEFFTQG